MCRYIHTWKTYQFNGSDKVIQKIFSKKYKFCYFSSIFDQNFPLGLPQ